jgi:Flagellar transcriptional activator (FlhC)
MGTLERHHRFALAIRLIGHHTKLSIVHAATEVRLETLRRLYREVHGRAPRGGPLANSVGTVVKTRGQQAHASLFASLYLARRGPVLYQAIDYIALADAYELYLALLPRQTKPLLPINLAWAVATDLRGGQASFSRCHRCDVQYLLLHTGSMGLRCPLCALYARA